MENQAKMYLWAKAAPFGSCYFCEMEDGKCKMETATNLINGDNFWNCEKRSHKQSQLLQM